MRLPFKRFLPRSLLGRTLLIVLVPLIVVQAVAMQIFYGTHLNLVSRRLSAAVTGEIVTTVALVERSTDEATRAWALQNAWDSFETRITPHPAGPLPPRVRPGLLTPSNNGVEAGLRDRLGYPFTVDWESDPQSVLITVALPDGNLRIEAPRKRLFAATFSVFMLWLVGSSLLVFAIATLFVRNQVRSIRRLGWAVEAFGLGREVGPLKPEGAAEVRQAAAAFNRMQERVTRFLAQRTEMLAGVSHDLRTPLTRLRLALAMMPQNEATAQDISDMTGDIAEMERLVEAYLAFARGEGSEKAEPVDLGVLLADLVVSARRAGRAVALEVEPELVVLLRPGAFRRAVTNLIDNAGRHANHVALRAQRQGERFAEVIVDDDGPGIAPERREAAFKPFESGTGSTGLGLTIARDIVRAHGGALLLEESPMGGLRARIKIPV